MRLAFLIVVLVAVLAVVGGFIAAGMFPPQPRSHAVDRVVPNDQFRTH